MVKSHQVGGTHYKEKNIQPWDIRKDWKLDPWTADVVRYLSRHQSKNGKEDIEKLLSKKGNIFKNLGSSSS